MFLPQLGKILDRSLALGHLQSLSGLTKIKKGTSLPVFLFEYFNLLFHLDGSIRDDLNPLTLRRLRTLLFMFYKLEVPFTDQQLAFAKEKFVQIDESVKDTFTDSDISAIRTTFNSLLPANPMDIAGRHSSGATADGYDIIKREKIYRYIPSLSRVYNPWYFFNTVSSFKRYIADNNVVNLEPRSKVAFVPKDSRGPRTICMEPHERMYAQQGLMLKIYEHIENFSDARGRVNFTRQDINQRLAQFASLDGSYATLDLKDASDLVSWSLIEQLVGEEYRACLTALRTPVASLDGLDVRLKKFAPMGSALCFPIEAILFYSIVKTITDDVYVYGDDIIVPNIHAQSCIDALERYGLLVNRDKSLYTGFFRESCGLDAYKGAIVTPIRYRKDDYASVVAYANLIRSAFGDISGLTVIDWYESIAPVIIPRLCFSTSYPGHIGYYTDRENLCMFKRRYNVDLQRYEYRLLSTTVTEKNTSDRDECGLYDWLSRASRTNSPVEDSKFTVPDHKVAFERDIIRGTRLVRERLTWKWVAI